VEGILQRPYIDYTFASGTLTFVTVPPGGAVVVVESAAIGAYWQYVDTLTVDGIDANAKLGTSISTDQTANQILVGAPDDSALDNNGDSIADAGAVYAFDRGTVRYVVTDTTQLTYAIPGVFLDPVAVILNQQYLTNTSQYINGQFTVVGTDIVLSNDVVLTVGDILEIDTNQFQLVQRFTADTVIDKSKFGQSLALCDTSCSVYVGAPFDSSAAGVPQAGMVQRQINQSRIYGIISSTVANPTLTPGDTIRINGAEVAVPASPNNTVAGLVQAINTAGIPNATATVLPNVILSGNGTTKIFDIGNVYSSASAYSTVVYINTVLQTAGVDYTYNNATQQIAFVSAPVLGAEILVVAGRMTVSVINLEAAQDFNKLTVLPGLAAGSAFDDLGFTTYAYAQTIISPAPTEFAQFGSSVSVNTGALNLVVGSPNGDVYEPTTFDAGQTIIDDRSTTFFGYIENSGVVFTFDFLPSAVSSVDNPGKFVFGQQIDS
jgi:hypothetical protein